MIRFPRSAGLLMHVTSLPGEFGIGDLGEGAHRFVDFLHEAGQQVWQILPFGPPATGNSPYSCYSAFAGNPLLISPSWLVREGLLAETAVETLASFADGHVDFEGASEIKSRMLESSFQQFVRSQEAPMSNAFDSFRVANRDWLADFALFIALVGHFKTSDWSTWGSELVRREDAALAHWRGQLRDRIEFEEYKQFLFYRQWQQLRQYAQERSVRIFGDMPIFVDHNSADVWANQDIFFLDEAGRPTVVAGVPPDYFSTTGQLWGNPLYRWDRLSSLGFNWWSKRLTFAFRHVDMLRIDHFRAFQAYWEIPHDAETAAYGRWVDGPGEAPFRVAEVAMKSKLPIVAEDLGMITDDVHALRDKLEYPGMRVLQFGYAEEHDDYHRPSAYPEHSAAYTGTHDNETTVGWQQRCLAEGNELVSKYLGDKDHWQLIELVFQSKADTAIVPMQDLLGLGNEARMNIPGEANGNWAWRCHGDSLNVDTAERLRAITVASGRG